MEEREDDNPYSSPQKPRSVSGLSRYERWKERATRQASPNVRLRWVIVWSTILFLVLMVLGEGLWYYANRGPVSYIPDAIIGSFGLLIILFAGAVAIVIAVLTGVRMRVADWRDCLWGFGPIVLWCVAVGVSMTVAHFYNR